MPPMPPIPSKLKPSQSFEDAISGMQDALTQLTSAVAVVASAAATLPSSPTDTSHFQDDCRCRRCCCCQSKSVSSNCRLQQDRALEEEDTASDEGSSGRAIQGGDVNDCLSFIINMLLLALLLYMLSSMLNSSHSMRSPSSFFI